jgi:hypothetical protein
MANLTEEYKETLKRWLDFAAHNQYTVYLYNFSTLKPALKKLLTDQDAFLEEDGEDGDNKLPYIFQAREGRICENHCLVIYVKNMKWYSAFLLEIIQHYKSDGYESETGEEVCNHWEC